MFECFGFSLLAYLCLCTCVLYHELHVNLPLYSFSQPFNFFIPIPHPSFALLLESGKITSLSFATRTARCPEDLGFFFLFRRCISDLRVVGFSGFTAGGTVPMLRVACYVRVMAEAVLPRLRGWTLLRVPACVAAAIAHARADIDDVVVLVRVAVGVLMARVGLRGVRSGALCLRLDLHQVLALPGQ